MSEESIITIIVALLGSALLPTLINKIKPKSELDAVNIENAIKLSKELEARYDKLEQKFSDLEERYSRLESENELLEEENIKLKRENDLYKERVSVLENRVAEVEKELSKQKGAKNE